MGLIISLTVPQKEALKVRYKLGAPPEAHLQLRLGLCEKATSIFGSICIH